MAGHRLRGKRRAALSAVRSTHLLAVVLGFFAVLLPKTVVAAPPTAGRLLHSSLQFEANRGQGPPSAAFLLRTSRYTAAFHHGGAAEFVLPGQKPEINDVVVRTEFAGAGRRVAGLGEKPLPATGRYYRGADPAAWLPDIPAYASLRFPGLYPNIDVICQGRGGELEYEFLVAPGGDPGRIRLRFRNIRRTRLDADGNLHVETPAGSLQYRRPSAWQEDGGARRAVAIHYRLSRHTLSFATGRYDPALPLFIDPVISYAAVLGGAGFDAAYAVAADTAGNIYLTGETASTYFPGASPRIRAYRDAFVTKLAAGTSEIVYTTILSGSGNDAGFSIAADASGQAYIAGKTAGSGFPVTPGAFQTLPDGSENGFVARLDAAGRLSYSTLLGGSRDDWATGIAVDGGGHAYVCGFTASSDFPTSSSAPQKTFGGGFDDAFLVKLTNTGAGLLYSTLLGGSGIDLARAVAVDPSGVACVAGYTDSFNLPVYKALHAKRGGNDALAACLEASGSAWRFVTYLGGSSQDEAFSIALDGAGSVHLAGATSSSDFPTTASGCQRTKSGEYDAFVAKLNPAGDSIAYSTFLGGTSNDAAAAVVVDAAGRMWVSGYTASADFPLRNPWQALHGGGGFDAFVAQLAAAGELMLSSYLGGAGDDKARGLAIAGGDVLAAGETGSANFVTVP